MTVWKRLFDHAGGLLRQGLCDLVSVKFPRSAQLALTHRCKSPDGEDLPSGTEMSPSEYRRLFASPVLRRHLQEVWLTGGDPFARDDLSAIVASVPSSAEVVVWTWAGFPDRTLEALSDCPRPVSVGLCIDGNEEAADRLSGLSGSYRRSIFLLRKLTEAGVNVLVDYVITPLNCSRLYDTFRMVRELGATIRFGIGPHPMYTPRISWQSLIVVERNITFQQLRRILDESADELNGTPLGVYYAHIRDVLRGRTVPAPVCRAGLDSFFVDLHGDVFVCRESNVPMGSLRRDSFSRIWKSARAMTVRQSVADGDCHRHCYLWDNECRNISSSLWGLVENVGRTLRSRAA